MADNVLGITGVVNIDDIKTTFDNLISTLDKVGIKTEEMSRQMSSALAEIANTANDDLATKTSKALDVLKSTIAEANKELGGMPDTIRQAQEQVDKMQQSCDKLQEVFGHTVVGSDEFDKLNKQLTSQQDALTGARNRLADLSTAYSEAQQRVSSLQLIYDGLSQSVGNAGRAMNVTSTANTIASTGEAAATAATTAALAGKTAAEAATAAATVGAAGAAEKSSEANTQQVITLQSLKQELKDAQKELENLQKTYNEANYDGQINSLYGKSERQQKQVERIEQEPVQNDPLAIGMHDKSLADAKAKLAEYDQQIEATIDAQNRAKESIQSCSARVEELKNQIATFDPKAASIDAAKESLDQLRNSFQEVRKSSQETQQGINEMSSQSQQYAAQAQQLKAEIEQLSAAYRNASSLSSQDGGFKSQEDKAAALDAIKQKIEEYGELMAKASATSETSYAAQVEHIKALEGELSTLSQMMQQATASGNIQAGGEIASQMQTLSAEITKAKGRLQELQGQLSQSRSAMAGLSSEQDKMTESVTKSAGIFTKFSDIATGVKSKISELWDSFKNSEPVETLKNGINTAQTAVSGFFDKIANTKPVQFLSASAQEAGSAISGLTKKLTNFMGGGGAFKEGIGEISKALEGMGIPLAATKKGVVALLTSMRAMIATPIGAAITAVVLALQALSTYFKKSADGQRAMIKISAAFGSIMSSLTDIVVMFGRYMFKYFDPQPAILLAKAVGGTLLNAIKTIGYAIFGVGNTIKGVWDGLTKGDWSGVSKGWDNLKKAGESLLGVVKGLGETIVASYKAAVSGANSAIKMISDTNLQKEFSQKLDISKIATTAGKAVTLADKQKTAEVELANAKSRQLEIENKLAEKKEEIYRLTGKAKDAAIEEAKALSREQYQSQIDAQQKILNLTKARHNLHEKTLQDFGEERDAKIALLQLEVQQASSTRMLTRMQESNRRSMASAAASAAKKGITSANSTTSAEDKLSEVENKNNQARLNEQIALEEKITDARINAIKDGAERTREQKNREFEKELLQIEDQRRKAIAAEIARQKAEFDAQQGVVKARGGKIQKWDEERDLDKTPLNKINEQYGQIKEYKVTIKENTDNESYTKNLRDYLKQYGTYQQQKLAIAEEYAEKIRQAQAKGDVGAELSARQEQAKAELQIEEKTITTNIDWYSVFNGLGDLYEGAIRGQLADLQKVIQSDAFSKMDGTQQQAIVDAMDKLRGQLGSSDISWRDIATQMANYQNALQAKVNAENALAQAQANYAGYIKQVQENKANNPDYVEDKDTTKRYQLDIDNANKALTEAGNKVKASGSLLQSTSKANAGAMSKTTKILNELNLGPLAKISQTIDTISNAAKSLKALNAAKDAAKGLKDLKDSTNEMKNATSDIVAAGGDLSKKYGDIGDKVGEGMEAIDKVSKSGGKVGDAVGKAGDAVQKSTESVNKGLSSVASSIPSLWAKIIGAIIDLLTTLGENGLSPLVDNLLHTIFKAVEGILADLPNLVVTVVKNLGLGVAGIVQGFGRLFGAKNGWLLSTGNEDEVKKSIQKLTDKNKLLTDAIEKLTEVIKNGESPSKSLDAYTHAVEAQTTVQKNLMGIVMEQAGYHGNHHSWGVEWAGITDPTQIQWIQENVDSNFNGGTRSHQLSWLYNLTPEQMQKLLSNYDIREAIKATYNDSGYGDAVLEKLDNYAKEADKLKDLSDELDTRINGISFDSFKNNFLEALSDMSNGVDELGQNIEKTLWESFIKNGFEEEFSDRIKKIYKDMTDLNKKRAEMAKNGTPMSDSEYQARAEQIHQEKADLVQDAYDYRKNMAEIYGYDEYMNSNTSSQSGTYGTATNITQDQANEISGRLTALQYNAEQRLTLDVARNASLSIVQVDLNATRLSVAHIEGYVTELIDIQQEGLGYLKNIDRNTSPLPNIESMIEQITKKVKEL